MKNRIFYHRAYKRLEGVNGWASARLFALVAVLDALIAYFHRPLLDAFVGAVGRILAWCGVGAEVVYWPFLPVWVKQMPVLDAAGVFPSRLFALVTFVVCLLLVVVVPRVRRLPRVIVVYAVFLSLLNLASSAFFITVPHRFPYDVADFSLLYMGTQLGMWLLLPVVMGMALSTLQAPTLEKLGVILASLAYAALFGAVRYASFIYLLREITVLNMAAMFFALGPLVDFVYLVAIYSLYVNLVALRLRRTPESWRWLFSS